MGNLISGEKNALNVGYVDTKRGQDLINEKTKLPLGIAVLVIGGGAMWLTNMANQTALAIEKAEAVEKRVSDVEEKQDEIIQSLARIEGFLNKGAKHGKRKIDSDE